MKICLIQHDITWGKAAANIDRVAALMARQPDARLYVLPEMWCTGFQTAPDATTADAAREGWAWMEEEARRRDCYIAGSLPVAHGAEGRFANRLVVMGPKGPVAQYDKRHLFTYGNEPLHYQPGTQRVVVSVDGVRILLQVCYDLRFPVFARNRRDYDLTLYVANWPESRQAVWYTLLRARAIENQCYVAGVNRVGDDPQCHYAGGSALVDAYGKTVAELADAEGAVAAELDLARLARFREKFAVLADADAFDLPDVTDIAAEGDSSAPQYF